MTQKAFSTFSGINFDEKVVNVWENNRIEGVTEKDVQKTNIILKLYIYIKIRKKKFFEKLKTNFFFKEISN